MRTTNAALPPHSQSQSKPAVVVGARGKVGSTITSLLRAKQYGPIVAINRGDDRRAVDAAFGALPPKTPVWLCVTTDALGAALESLPPDRLDDSIILQNGVVAEELRRAAAAARRQQRRDGAPPLQLTRLMLYLRAAAPTCDHPWEDGGGRTLVRPGGRHSEHAAAVLPGASVAKDRGEFLRAARDKLAWCSSAWLLSQAHGGLPLGELARGLLGEELRALACELAGPAMAAAAGEEEDDEDDEEEGRGGVGGPVDDQAERLACADAVWAYCTSIAGAIPSRDLALREWKWRNGAVLRAAQRLGVALPLQAAWCERAGVGVGVDGVDVGVGVEEREPVQVRR